MTPLIYLANSLVVIILFLTLYCKLTMGRCRSQQDMSGKTVLITGASAGLGKITAMDLARRNARVILACRNLKKAEKVKSEIISATGNTNVEVKHLELESFDSVRKCAEDVLKTERRLDVLINNAGVAAFDLETTVDGCETALQTNHFGHFLLTLLLLDLLKNSQPSRIINLTSICHLMAVFDFDDMMGTKQNFIVRNIGNLYSRSKLANIWFTTELARRLADTGVTVNCLHPGVINTDIFHKSEHPVLFLWRFFLFFLGKTPEEGAQTSIYLAVHPEVEKVTGKYFYDCRERRLFGQPLDEQKARKFFEISEEIVGTTFQS